ncbi:hypothetical protein BRD10_00665 [Halobacteriales archaeon SW_12_71_31]|nr:MAG: hypothetical protein BRD10_00665 [Halobacteriales archaeon SW_12_71_31]
MDERRRGFLAGERPSEVLLYLSDDAVDDPDRLAGAGGGERVDGGTVVVVDGERGRQAFAAATGVDAMSFAGRARGRDGDVRRSLTGGTCPNDTSGEVDGENASVEHAEDGDIGDGEDGDVEDGENADAEGGDDHHARFLFAFVEAHQPDGQGLYAEGDVVHAYAQCSCGVAYSDRWVAEG